ncbi:MAG: formate C-acetyltransferase/glycerol dehydratase family glycyl radical enzyme, partial [Clostridia bacterium]|nr:formate C-acetyltransferase/glycerol dehydratase family glycyl radical enzyme [Clostridia bacterium]
DTNGPTALINSCLSFDHTLPGSGFILNLKFDRDIFRSEGGRAAFIPLVKRYFEGGGQMLTFTVVSEEELRDAQVNPDAHRDLIVRVGGYSDYFVNISKSLQNNVIARTSIKV